MALGRRARLVPLIAAPFAIAALAAASDADSTRAPAPPPAAAPHRHVLSAGERARRAYEHARAHGAPVAILQRPTVLRAAPGGRRITALGGRTEWGSPMVLAAVAVRRGWLRVIATEVPNGRRGWIPASAAMLVADHWAVHADLSRRRVQVLRDGRVVRSFTVGIGSPRTPTPTGRFAVTDRIHMIGASPYGCCVLALTGHQPNIAQGWTGDDRLAIHGTTEPASIGRAASLGCLRAREADVHWLISHVYLGTIVEIRP